MEHTVNRITLRGSLQTLPEFSHENHGRKFLKFFLEVPRLSGAVDVLPILAEEKILGPLDPTAGGMLLVSGQIRTHNNRENGVRRLIIYVFAECIQLEDGEPINDVYLEGPICKEPIYRKTPLGRQICDVMLAVPRQFRRAAYIPCILWGRTAQEIAGCQIRECIRIQGRLQSRVYTKVTEAGSEERTAYEVSALHADILEEIL